MWRNFVPLLVASLLPIGPALAQVGLQELTRPAGLSETLGALIADLLLGPLLRTDYEGVHGISAGGLSALALARQVAQTQVPGGLPSPHFSAAQRQQVINTTARFFNQHLQP